VRTIRIPVKKAVPGMIAAEDIYNTSNQLVISKGTKLSDKVITRLKFHLISDLFIIIEDKKPEVPEKTNASFSEITKESVEFKHFNKAFVESVHDFKGELNKIMDKDAPIDTSGLLQHATSILSESRNGMHVFEMLHCMREYDDLTYVHSLNVALICNVFGKWLKLSESDIEILTLSGMLHDIGKQMLPASIINKQGVLTIAEYSTIKTHTIQGYNILKDQDIDQRVKYATLMHHERCDGSGYPNKLHGPEIESFAKIIAIVDVYDAMTSARVYRPALSPFSAISIFESEGLQKYDPHYIMTFLQEIVQSYVGNRVRLSNNLEGEIRLINKNSLSKPVVQCGSNFIDLSKESNISIVKIL
jgi:putative nucleotidyltransferase with HDIG domain